jgi:hypothetical protein
VYILYECDERKKIEGDYPCGAGFDEKMVEKLETGFYSLFF